MAKWKMQMVVAVGGMLALGVAAVAQAENVNKKAIAAEEVKTKAAKAEPKKASKAKPEVVETEGEKGLPASTFTPPADGSPKEVFAYADKLLAMKGKTDLERLQLRVHRADAIRKAAMQVFRKVRDRNHKDYKAAMALYTKSRGLGSGKGLTTKDVEAEMKYVMALLEKKGENMTSNEAMMAYSSGKRIENIDGKLAVKAYESYAKALGKAKNPRVKMYAQRLKSAAVKAGLLGGKMELTGKTVDGKDFDWSKYRGKVVLVDFWATWCGPCIREHPNIKKNYAKYKDKGFAIVGISLDRNRAKLEGFIKKHKMEWVNLFEDGAGWKHPMAVKYGVRSIPSMILVDKEGKVVSLSARGPTLGRLLDKMLGKPKVD